MPKKVSHSKKIPAVKKEGEKLEKVLIENFVSLQKVLTNLSVKFDSLSDQISKLLQLFEISAKALAEKDFAKYEKSDSKEILEKLNDLVEQNKTIARSLAMMHEKNLPGESDDELMGSDRFEKYKSVPKY